MEFNIITNKSQIKRIKALGDEFKEGLNKSLVKQAKFLVDKIKEGFGDAGKPKVRTGELKNSINYTIDSNDISIYSDKPYSWIQEKGGIIEGKPWLMFKIGNNFIKKKSVKLNAKPYIEPVVLTYENYMIESINNDIIDSMNKE